MFTTCVTTGAHENHVLNHVLKYRAMLSHTPPHQKANPTLLRPWDNGPQYMGKLVPPFAMGMADPLT